MHPIIFFSWAKKRVDVSFKKKNGLRNEDKLEWSRTKKSIDMGDLMEMY